MANNCIEESIVMKKIDDLRQWMKQEKLDIFLIPRADMFKGENVAPCDERLKWFTGFSGSAGTAIVAEKKAGLFVDGRYTLQAPAQVDTEVFDICPVPQTKPAQWIKDELLAGGLVGFDPWLHSLAQIRSFKKAFDLSGIIMKPINQNPIDEIWPDRPTRESNPIWHHDLKYAGKTSQEKRGAIKESFVEKDIAAVLITDTESVSWLFNIRGKDVPNTPLVQAFAWLSADGDDVLFIDQSKISNEVKLSFDIDIVIEDLSEISDKIKLVSELGTTVQVDPNSCPYALYNVLTSCAISLSENQNPCLMPKACKNSVEIPGAKKAHVTDGVALVKFMHWFESEVSKGNLDELSVVDKLHDLRAQRDGFVEDSFDTIAGFGSNGAIVHYRADEKTNLSIAGNNLLLLDSGGQYHCGTTDITRTIAVGTPTAEMIDRNTRVLKGMITISQARFPVGTTGANIDILARQALWEAGIDFSHGTGHGVGSFLNVHEGPQGIHRVATSPLLPGMIVSNEPGYYKEGEYGIRIENLIFVVDDTREGEEQKMLSFETLTLAPIDWRLIDKNLLSNSEKTWLTDYHARVLKELSDDLSSDEKEWLSSIL